MRAGTMSAMRATMRSASKAATSSTPASDRTMSVSARVTVPSISRPTQCYIVHIEFFGTRQAGIEGVEHRRRAVGIVHRDPAGLA